MGSIITVSPESSPLLCPSSWPNSTLTWPHFNFMTTDLDGLLAQLSNRIPVPQLVQEDPLSRTGSHASAFCSRSLTVSLPRVQMMTCSFFLLRTPLLKTYPASYQFRAAKQGGFGDGKEEGVIDKQLLSAGRSGTWESLLQITGKSRPSARFPQRLHPLTSSPQGPPFSAFAPAFLSLVFSSKMFLICIFFFR